MTDVDKLKRARMSLAQGVNRSSAADSLSDRQAVEQHRAAAELWLRDGGAEHLGFKINRDLEPATTAARKNMREVMQLVDAELEFGGGFERAASDGGVEQ